MKAIKDLVVKVIEDTVKEKGVELNIPIFFNNKSDRTVDFEARARQPFAINVNKNIDKIDSDIMLEIKHAVNEFARLVELEKKFIDEMNDKNLSDVQKFDKLHSYRMGR